MSTPQFIYKITTRAVFAPAEESGAFRGMPIDARDGYMHFSTAAQLRDTLRLHFAGEDDLLLLAVRTADIADKLKWEPSRGGDLFPHLYGDLPVSTIAWQETISVAPDGKTTLPEAVR